jgi:hypothetical protein
MPQTVWMLSLVVLLGITFNVHGQDPFPPPGPIQLCRPIDPGTRTLEIRPTFELVTVLTPCEEQRLLASGYEAINSNYGCWFIDQTCQVRVDSVGQLCSLNAHMFAVVKATDGTGGEIAELVALRSRPDRGHDQRIVLQGCQELAQTE